MRLEPFCSPQFTSLLENLTDVPQHVGRLLPLPGHQWSISPDLGVLLFRLVTQRDRGRILEFGAGSSSTIVAAGLAERGGGRLTSVEQSPEWCRDKWELVKGMPNVDAELIASQPRLEWHAAGLSYVYASAAPRIAARAPYDLVLVDAPQYYRGRDGALPASDVHLQSGALIVVDDAKRSGEQWAIRRWLRTYAGLELRVYAPAFGGKGVAVLEVVRPLHARANVFTAVSSCYHAIEHWSKRRKRSRRERAKQSTGGAVVR